MAPPRDHGLSMASKKKSGKAPEIPEMMEAAAIDRFGPPEALTLHTLPVPEIGARDVLIAVQVAGVGFWDAKIRSGAWAERNTHFPLVLGTDGSGIVVGKGAHVRRLAVGDRVWGYQYENPKGGFYAEYVAMPSENVARIPQALSLQHAGAGCVTSLTALQGIEDHLELARGETVLIFGASGAVGTLAIQFAKRRKARVIAAASGRDGVTLARRLGADWALDGKGAKAVQQLHAMAPEGVDAVFALVGGDVLERCLELVRPGGRVVLPNGVEPEPGKRRNLRVITFDAVAEPSEFERLARAVGEVKLRIPIAKTFLLAQANEAHTLVEESHVLGRVALRVRRGGN